MTINPKLTRILGGLSVIGFIISQSGVALFATLQFVQYCAKADDVDELSTAAKVIPGSIAVLSNVFVALGEAAGRLLQKLESSQRPDTDGQVINNAMSRTESLRIFLSENWWKIVPLSVYITHTVSFVFLGTKTILDSVGLNTRYWLGAAFVFNFLSTLFILGGSSLEFSMREWGTIGLMKDNKKAAAKIVSLNLLGSLAAMCYGYFVAKQSLTTMGMAEDSTAATAISAVLGIYSFFMHTRNWMICYYLFLPSENQEVQLTTSQNVAVLLLRILLLSFVATFTLSNFISCIDFEKEIGIVQDEYRFIPGILIACILTVGSLYYGYQQAYKNTVEACRRGFFKEGGESVGLGPSSSAPSYNSIDSYVRDDNEEADYQGSAAALHA